MLKRRSKIQKYISILKKKHQKKHAIENHTLLKHKLQHHQQALKVEQHPLTIQIQQEKEVPCWNDADDHMPDEKIQINQKNKFRKLINFGMTATPTIQEYEDKFGKFYKSKTKMLNWAKQGQDIEQKDINDYLNQQVYFSDKKPAQKTIKFYAKTSEKHQSIVSGLDWHKNVMFTCGLDHKVKVWHFQSEQINPQLKLKLQKDIYMEDLPLSNCFHLQRGLLIGTLRKNLVQIDLQKWKPTFITTSFLKDHKTYQNLRVCEVNSTASIFTGNKVGLIDKNNVFIGNLQTNQPIQDVCFNKTSGNSIFAIGNDSIYEWDLRKFGIIRMEKKYLGFTSLSVGQHSINIGSKLGTIYLYNINNLKEPTQNNNLVTHVTQIRNNKNDQFSVALSKWKNNAIRVIDSVSGKSIGEWPGVKTKVGMPMQAGFNCYDYFGVGSSHGHISVYGFANQMI